MHNFDFINKNIGGTVYITGDRDLGIQGELRMMIRDKTPLKIIKVTKSGHAYLQDEKTNRFYTIPIGNVREFGLTFNQLKDKAAKFSDSHFGADRPAHLPLKKLSEEAKELAECLIDGNIDPLDEYADCFLVLIDSFRKYYGDNVDMQKLIDACSKKLDVNTNREWKYNPDTDTFRHV
jgi:hypothetical protein